MRGPGQLHYCNQATALTIQHCDTLLCVFKFIIFESMFHTGYIWVVGPQSQPDIDQESNYASLIQHCDTLKHELVLASVYFHFDILRSVL